MEYLYLLPILGLGFFAGTQWANIKKKVQNNADQLRISQIENALSEALIQKNALEQEKEQLNIKTAKLETSLEYLERQRAEDSAQVKAKEAQFKTEFEHLAQKILQQTTQQFTLHNKEQMNSILDPLKEKITGFEKKVEDSQKENVGLGAKLEEQLKQLYQANQQMSQEAQNLTKALKGDSKTQGNWGEMVLERVLEKSGLERGREYEVQQSFTASDGQKQMPDVVIYMPQGKKLIVDSKVSLTDYERYVNAETESEKALHLKNHINSLKKHIDQLSAKRYEDLYEMESPDFVLLFVPVESAFATAINEEHELYSKAFDKNIVVVTPSTLLATLRTVETMWTNEKQRKNALEIAQQAGSLYDKFQGLLEDLKGIGSRLENAKTFYDGAMNKLSTGKGNLVGGVEKLKQMGAKAKKALPDAWAARALDTEENEA